MKVIEEKIDDSRIHKQIKINKVTKSFRQRGRCAERDNYRIFSQNVYINSQNVYFSYYMQVRLKRLLDEAETGLSRLNS